MTQEINIRHIRRLDEFETLQEQWANLLSQREIKTVFLTWEWLISWWKTHLKGKDLWLITAWRNDELVGVAPLMLSRESKYGLHFRLLQSLGALNTDEGDFLAKDNDPIILHALCDYILQNKSYWDAIKLYELRVSQTSTNIIKNRLIHGKLTPRIISNWHFYISILETWDEYFKSLSKNMAKNLKKRLRGTKKIHEMVFEHLKGQDIRWEYFETIFEVNNNGTFPDKYKSKTERAFHRALFEHMKSKEWIELAFVTLDKKPVAFEYGFNIDGRFEDWRTGYDKSFSKQAVAKTLLYLLLQELHNQEYQSFDFLRGEYDHKKDWKPLKNEFFELTAVQPFHISARIALIIIPHIWQQYKEHILPVITKFKRQFWRQGEKPQNKKTS